MKPTTWRDPHRRKFDSLLVSRDATYAVEVFDDVTREAVLGSDQQLDDFVKVVRLQIKHSQ